MKIKYTILSCMFISVASLFAGEPSLLKKDKGNEFLKKKPTLFSKSKMAANDDGMSNIAIKLNLSQLAIKNISLQGEYAFHKKMSVALGANFLLRQDVPIDMEDTTGHFSQPTFAGFGITPEFRFYPGGSGDKPAPHGFYISAYLRYASFNLKQHYEDGQFSGDTKLTYAGITYGLMIGQQWVIGKHVTLDWWILGAGYGSATAKYKYESPNVNMSQQEQEDLKTETREFWGGTSYYGVEQFDIETTTNSVTFIVRGLPMYSLRGMGLCLGFAF